MMFSIGIMMGSQELLMENLSLVKQRRSVNMSNFSPLTFAAAVSVSGSGGGGGSGTSNYEALSNLPKINGVTLAGSKTSSDLKITSITSYTELSDKPSIEGITLSGNKTLLELGIAGSKEVETRLAKFYPYLYTGRDLVEVFGVSTAVQAF